MEYWETEIDMYKNVTKIKYDEMVSFKFSWNIIGHCFKMAVLPRAIIDNPDKESSIESNEE